MPGTSWPRRCSARISGMSSSAIQVLWLWRSAVRGEAGLDREPLVVGWLRGWAGCPGPGVGCSWVRLRPGAGRSRRRWGAGPGGGIGNDEAAGLDGLLRSGRRRRDGRRGGRSCCGGSGLRQGRGTRTGRCRRAGRRMSTAGRVVVAWRSSSSARNAAGRRAGRVPSAGSGRSRPLVGSGRTCR